MERDFSKEYSRIASEFARRVSDRLGPVVRSITLFGSVARGQADPDSDIDVLVVLDPDTPEDHDAVRGVALDVELEYQAPLAVKIFSQKRMENLKALDTPFIRSVMGEGETLWTRKP